MASTSSGLGVCAIFNFYGAQNEIVMYRNDSQESTESPFGSVLNTPADESALCFDSVDAKLLAERANKMVERLDTPVRVYDSDLGSHTPRRVSMSRQFAKAVADAHKSTVSQAMLSLLRSNSIETQSRSKEIIESTPSGAEDPHRDADTEEEKVQEPVSEFQIPRESPEIIFEKYDDSSYEVNRTATLDYCDVFSPTPRPIPFPSGSEAPPSTLRQRRKSICTLPNDTIAVHAAEPAISDDDALSAFDDDTRPDLPSLATLTSPLLPLRVLLFPSWCALVGGAILLAPAYLAPLAFHTGFCAPPAPGIRTFAHWAAIARYHVALFLAALAGTAYAHPPLGALLAAAAALLFVRAWADFRPMDDAPLGADTRQMLYSVLVDAGCGFGGDEDDGRVRLRREGEEYFFVRTPGPRETKADILAAAGLADSDDSDAE
ncbi:hypothetical protein B0H10DRAFT_2206655 [Mycena sp. CBHHK59/15]|nr:hypothetical protein B0H10DRAFT_2206655 [Mycena sp. CBHHK59/15]